MKTLYPALLISAALYLLLSIAACEEENICEDFVCANSGTSSVTEIGCACDCSSTLFTGPNCEEFDPAQIQALLDAGVTPKALIEADMPIDSLYGKSYLGGLIFYLDPVDCSGLVAAATDQGSDVEWGCNDMDIEGLNNVLGNPTAIRTMEGARVGDGAANTNAILAACSTEVIAARICRELGPDWFLPSLLEIELMQSNLHNLGYGGFSEGLYWSSTEVTSGLGWYRTFFDDTYGGNHKDSPNNVRAIRSFGE